MALSLIFGERDPEQVAPEVEHYFGVVGAAATHMCDGLYAGLGSDVLDDEDYAAMFPAEAPTPAIESANNVISFPVQPGINAMAAMATAGEAVATPAGGQPPFEVVAPTVPVPPAPVDAIQDFPPLREAA